MSKNTFQVDTERRNLIDLGHLPETGIYVRARYGDSWGSYDIAALDAKSLLSWLQSGGGCNQLAENTVGILLGHGHINTEHQ